MSRLMREEGRTAHLRSAVLHWDSRHDPRLTVRRSPLKWRLSWAETD